MAAKSVMRQSIFDEPQPTLPALPGATAAGMPTVGMPARGSEQQQLALALQTIEARAQRTALVGIALGGAALLAGVGSLVVLALR
jgi:hypothetical protein